MPLRALISAAIFTILAMHGLAQTQTNIELPDSTRKRLAFELFEIYITDQHIRHTELWRATHRLTDKETDTSRKELIGDTRDAMMLVTDSINFDRFFNMVRQYGWPSAKRLQPYVINHNCFTITGMPILLHNPKRIVKEHDIYQLLKHEALVGRLDKRWLADALDKYYVFYEYRSLYGTQMKNWKRCTLGGVSIHDRQLSDSLRRDIGLPPLDENEFVTPPVAQ